MSRPYPPLMQANYSLAILLLAYIFSFIDRQILSLLVEPIRADLNISDFQISLLQGMAFAIFYVLMGIPVGRLADRGNRKLIIAVGICLWSIMTALCGMASTFAILFIARIGVGVGEAALSPASYSMLADYYPPKRLARATSIFSMGITIGSGLAFIVGGSVLSLVSTAGAIDLPMLGALKPWQIAFVVVGLPGLVISALAFTIKEPPRRGLMAGQTGTPSRAVPLSEVFRFILGRWKSYASIFGSIGLLSLFGYGFLNWYPTFLTRTYGMSLTEIGLKFGTLYLIFGSAGAISGALVSEFLARRGHQDANPKTVMLVALALTPMALGMLMPNATLALLFAVPTVFLLNAHFGVSIAAIQLITPNQMRAVMSALFLFITTLVGLGCGTSLVAFLTDFVFQDTGALRYSLLVVSLLTCPVAALTILVGLKPYGRALEEARSWDGSTTVKA